MATVLALNAGSSSLKFALFARRDAPVRQVWGQVERIGGDTVMRLQHAQGGTEHFALGTGCSAEAALDAVLEYLSDQPPPQVVGHRIVHGGAEFVGPQRLDPDVLRRLAALDPLAPLHQPHNLAAVRHFMQLAPQMLQVGVFDTGFHATMPPVAKRFGLPQALHERGIRRYGFHGLSYQHAAAELARRLPEARRVIVAHLGNGASLCAMQDGRSIETTLGFSALDGLLMGTRCGSLDPGVILHLLDVDGIDLKGLEALLYRQSGLLGVSGISHDMRDLLASGSAQAEAAIELFVYRVIQQVGALYSVLGGLDALVFTGGIGEHAAVIRDRIAMGLGWTGLRLDGKANAADASSLHSTDSAMPVLVVHCDEEQVIARACVGYLDHP